MKWEARYLNRQFGSILLEEIQGKFLFKICIYRIFGKKAKKLIGRQRDEVSGGLFSLGTRIIEANF